MKRSAAGLVLGASVAAALAAYFLWATLIAQRYECEVCVEFHRRRNCATASAISEAAAARSAQTTACGTLARGRIESAACLRTPPLERRCRKLPPSRG